MSGASEDDGSKACPPILVLDTNVVLDWLLCRDPRCDGLGAAIASGRLRWIASASMHDELRHVLARGIVSRRAGDPAAVLRGWDRWAALVVPWDRPSLRPLRCSDGDDQMFIDLALQVRASALLSRDRAVLKLARRADAHGLKILTVEAWQRQPSGPAAEQDPRNG